MQELIKIKHTNINISFVFGMQIFLINLMLFKKLQ
jgi:hypothetical protein